VSQLELPRSTKLALGTEEAKKVARRNGHLPLTAPEADRLLFDLVAALESISTRRFSSCPLCGGHSRYGHLGHCPATPALEYLEEQGYRLPEAAS
jgi:hypothetical protein